MRAQQVSTSASNALELFNSDAAPGLNIGVNALLKQAGFTQIQSIFEKGQGKWDLPLNSHAGVKLSEKVYPAGDRAILKDPIRKTCDESYRKSGQNVIWVETQGQAELGKSTEFIGQVRLRSLIPYESPSGTLPKGLSAAQSIQLPCQACVARKLAPGTEIEISGEGLLNLKLEFKATAKATGKKALSLLVQKLPQPDKVMVKLVSVHTAEGGLGIQYHRKPPELFGNLWNYFSKWLKPASVNIEGKKQYQNKSIKQYVFDLSKSPEAQAYEAIFFKCSIAKAERLTQKTSCDETSNSYDFNAGAALGDNDFTLFHAAESSKEAHAGKSYFKQFSSIQEHISKWFSKMSVVWEWISLENSENKFNKAYCHVKFDSPYASDFFDLTDALEIPSLKEAKEIFRTDLQTDIHIDVYFTETGIKNIQSSTFSDDFKSYLGKDSDSIQNLEAAKRYGEIQNKWFFTRWWFAKESRALESSYPELVGLKTQLKEAHAFAKKTNPFKGSLRRFSDIKSIAALMKIAGKKEVVIHELSIASPAIGIFNPDEGQILNPTEELTQQLASAS